MNTVFQFTHETTHVNDRAIYLGGFGHREGTDAEAYAQGMLQTPVTGSGFDEFGSLGINMVFKRKMMGISGILQIQKL